MGYDIFSFGSPRTFSRSQIEVLGEINVRELDLPTYELREGYDIQSITPQPYGDKWVKDALARVRQDIDEFGFPPGTYTGAYEAILNAFQHGHKKDPTKQIILAARALPERLDIGIIDHGGHIDARLASFILLQRTKEQPVPDFYTFIGAEKPEKNNGTGTKFMHIYFDKVRYFKAHTGGLAVHLTKYQDLEH